MTNSKPHPSLGFVFLLGVVAGSILSWLLPKDKIKVRDKLNRFKGSLDQINKEKYAQVVQKTKKQLTRVQKYLEADFNLLKSNLRQTPPV